jgi:hypothetical protein
MLGGALEGWQPVISRRAKGLAPILQFYSAKSIHLPLL